MNKLLTATLTLIITTSIFSCSQSTDSSTVKNDNANLSTVEQAPSKVYGIEGEDIPIRTGPGDKYDKIINEKATSAVRKTEYCQVDYSVKVEILEKKDKWTKIKVVEPDWLSNSHVGWIPAKYVLSKDSGDKHELAKLDPTEYEILKTRHNSAVENFHVLLKRKPSDKKSLHQFVEQFREETCTMNCNVNVYDSKTILPLIGVYPLPRKAYLKMADHLLSMSTFDAPEVRDWYPYQDFQYKEYGGKNWKKEPIK